MAKRKLRKVKYRVTGDFGMRARDEIIEAYVLIEDTAGGATLLFHPHSTMLGASMEMANQSRDGIYVAAVDEDISNAFGWVNLTRTNVKTLIRNLQEQLENW